MREIMWKFGFAYVEAVMLIVIVPLLFVYRMSKNNGVVCHMCYNAIKSITIGINDFRRLVYEEIIPRES